MKNRRRCAATSLSTLSANERKLTPPPFPRAKGIVDESARRFARGLVRWAGLLAFALNVTGIRAAANHRGFVALHRCTTVDPERE